MAETRFHRDAFVTLIRRRDPEPDHLPAGWETFVRAVLDTMVLPEDHDRADDRDG